MKRFQLSPPPQYFQADLNEISTPAHLLDRYSVLSSYAILRATQTAPISFEKWFLNSDFIHFIVQNNQRDNVTFCFIAAISIRITILLGTWSGYIKSWQNVQYSIIAWWTTVWSCSRYFNMNKVYNYRCQQITQSVSYFISVPMVHHTCHILLYHMYFTYSYSSHTPP
jgi:hypothetical protein